MTASNSLDIYGIIEPQQLASHISNLFDTYKSKRVEWERERKDLRDYVYATDTSTTANNSLPFANKTTLPKLMQIAQNLHANYFEHMFDDPRWINFEAHNNDSSLAEKRRTIESYVRTKAKDQEIEQTLSQMLWDWILDGNCFGKLVYVNENKFDPETGEVIPGYVGPRLIRISTADIVMNPAGSSFSATHKMERQLYSIGALHRMVEDAPEESGWTKDLLDRILSNRQIVRINAKAISTSDTDKSEGLIADGFSSIQEYYNSDLVEVITFYGDIYDEETQEFLKDCKVVVVDRAYIVEKSPVKSWTGSSYLYHDGWAQRPDNLYGMGPLDNIVGLQYKIDKLENLRADIFDHIAHPTVVEQGVLDTYGVRGAPGFRYVIEAEGGSVGHLAPDTTVLQADFQIDRTLALMEELAGSPREAMGLRSPGEKTAFEVQMLDNRADRIFRHKVRQFETNIIEPILNDMLEMGRRNIDGVDLIRAQDNMFGVQEFLSVTKEDLAASGKLAAKGSSHFLAVNKTLQNIEGLLNGQIAQLIAPHISKVELAKSVERLLGIEEFGLVQENIGVLEDIDTQRIAQQGQQSLEEESITDFRETEDELPLDQSLPF